MINSINLELLVIFTRNTNYKRKNTKYLVILFFSIQFSISRHVFDCGVVLKVMDVELSICPGLMELNVQPDIGVSMGNVYREIEKL